MILGTVTNAESKDFQIEKPFSGLAINITTPILNLLSSENLAFAKSHAPANGSPQFYFPTSEEITALIEKLSQTITISAYYKQKSGKGKYYFSSFPLMDLLELAQHEEGVIRVVYSSAEDIQIKAYLPLSNTGAIAFNNDETMTISVVGTDQGEAVKYTLEMYTVELPQIAHDYLDYTRLSVLQGQKEKKFDLVEFEKIMIPLRSITSTTVISLDYTNGVTVRYTAKELYSLGLLINDVCYASTTTGTVNGFGRFAILDCKNVKDIDIRRDSNTAFDIVAVKSKLVEDVLGSILSNEKLFDTTEEHQLNKLEAKLSI
ncbi:MAG: hypothetical protein HYR91_06200 [Flavobacteriia bacterium]|nr:hypothetical protein [Flavobacteriia bacterium]